jgi:hypothetical protein
MDTTESLDRFTIAELETLAYQYGRNRTEADLAASTYYQRLQTEIKKRHVGTEAS